MDIHNIIGRTFTSVGELPNREGIFLSDGVKKVVISHIQRGSEYVSLDEINGEIDHLLNSPIRHADQTEYRASVGFLNTIFHLETDNGFVELMFCGGATYFPGYDTVDVWEEEISP